MKRKDSRRRTPGITRRAFLYRYAVEHGDELPGHVDTDPVPEGLM